METKLDKVLDILNMFEFFYGQRAGRELWIVKSKELQDQDIANFVKNIKYIKDFLNESVILSKTDYELLTDIKALQLQVQDSLNNMDSEDITRIEKQATKATVEKCIQILEDMRVPEDGRHEWRDRHNDTLDRVKMRFTKEFGVSLNEEI